jgi:penicillin-binding protein 2
MKKRIKFILILFSLFGLVLISRVYFLSIKSNTYYEKLAQQNIIKSEYLVSTRGEILDREGHPLAINKLGFSLSLIPHLKKKQLKDAIALITQELLEFNATKLLKRYQKHESAYNHKPIMIVPFIPYDNFIEKFVLFSSQKDFHIAPAAKRFYPQGESMAHILGYVAKANEKDIKESKVTKLTGIAGKSGIEKYYNALLEGSLGEKKLKVTALNQPLGIIHEDKPHASRLTLTVDVKLQEYLKKIFGERSGALIVMDANSGAILAAGSYPEYDNNEFIQGISKEEWAKMIKDLNHPFTNKFIHGLYPPGSSTKPEVLLSFLNSKLVDTKEQLLCEGTLNLGKRKFRCWNQSGHGPVDAKRSLRESCDVYYYKGALRVGIDTISTDLKQFGFGKKTGIDMPSEFIGTVPNRNWKIEKFADSWYKGETLNTVIGQGNFLVTPIQVAAATALMATGKQVIPHFIKAVDEHNISFENYEILTKEQKSFLPLIRQGMYEVCNHKRGTAYKYNKAWIVMAGKTGTSQVVGIPQEEIERMSEDDLHYFKKSHAWFTTYAPYDNPKYIITAIVEHGGHGGKAAGEIVSHIYNYLVKLGYISKTYVKPSYLPLLESNTTDANQTTP